MHEAHFFENVDFSIGEEGAVGAEYVRRAGAAGAAAGAAAAAAGMVASSSSSSLKVEKVV